MKLTTLINMQLFAHEIFQVKLLRLANLPHPSSNQILPQHSLPNLPLTLKQLFNALATVQVEWGSIRGIYLSCFSFQLLSADSLNQ